MPTILVTGAAGFLGRHLVQALEANMINHVIAVDIEPAPISRGVSIVHDVRRPFDDGHHDIDVIYHLACPASPVDYQKRPEFTIETAVYGTHNVLKLARRIGARLVIASTSEVYGDPTTSPQRESYWGNVNPVGPRACYDEGKRAAETLAAIYHRNPTDNTGGGVVSARRFSVVVARIFNTYGPGMRLDDGRLVPEWFRARLTAQAPTLYDPARRRSLCYVDDTIAALRLLGEGPHSQIQDDGGLPIFNVGSLDERTIAAWGEIMDEVLFGGRAGAPTARARLEPARADDPHHRCPDTAKLRALGWRQHINVVEGLRRTAVDIRRRLDAGATANLTTSEPEPAVDLLAQARALAKARRASLAAEIEPWLEEHKEKIKAQILDASGRGEESTAVGWSMCNAEQREALRAWLVGLGLTVEDGPRKAQWFKVSGWLGEQEQSA